MAVSINGTSGLTFNDGTSVGTASSLGMRNRIINGAMEIDQRNAGASVTPTAGVYTLDRWSAVLTQASKFSVQQNAGSVTPPAGFTNYLGVTSLSSYSVLSSDTFMVEQLIEGFNFSDTAFGTASAKTITISFWARSSLTGTFGGSICNESGARDYPFSYTLSSANTWTQVSITVPGDTTGTWLTTNGTGARVRFGLGSGSTYTGTANAWGTVNAVQPTGTVSVVGTNGATFYLTGVQLEVGSVATPFERRLYGQELALCQRYYQYWGGSTNVFQLRGYNLTAGALTQTITYPVSFRTSPTVSIGTVTYSNASGLAVQGNERQGLMTVSVTASGDAYVTSSGTNKITFSAEL